MIICPVCEHPQAQGAECEVCGKVLAAPRAPAEAPVARMQELEVTQVANPKLRAPDTPMPELDVHRAGRVAEVPLAPVPDLEATRAQPVTVPVQAIPDLERHRTETRPEERTAAPTGATTCRYCRNVQAQGLVCERCGMRLPRYVPAAQATGQVGPEGGPVVRHACGVKTPSGQNCTSCGVFVPLPT